MDVPASNFAPHNGSGPGPEATGLSHILVVCTGNICRSPLGHILLASLLKGTEITVSSAGVYAMEGYGVDGGMLPEFSSRGLSPEGFVAHQINDDDIDGADLILTMSRRQRSYILDEWPHARNKTILLAAVPEVIKTSAASAQAGEASAPPSRGKRAARPLTTPSALINPEVIRATARTSLPHVDDIPDPYRKPAEQYAKSAALVETHSRTLAGALLDTISTYLSEKK